MKKYLAVYEKFKREITNGAYKTGAKLPSKRTVAANSEVSVITVEQAYELLSCEGYIEGRERSGYFVVYNGGAFGAKGFATTDAKSGNSTERTTAITLKDSVFNPEDYFPYSTYASVIRRILSEKADKTEEKSPSGGLPELRQAIADYLKRNRGISVNGEQIIVGAGSEYLYGLLADAVGDRKFAIEDPCYDKIEKVYSLRKIRYEKLPLNLDGIPTESLIKSTADVLHITPFQSYPSGVSVSISKKMEYLRFAARKNGFIIEDDYASEFSPTAKLDDTLFALDENDCVIYLNSFSKTIFPSIRVAYAVLPQRLLEKYFKTSGFYSCPVPVLEQYFITEILNDGSFERHINKVRRKKRALSQK